MGSKRCLLSNRGNPTISWEESLTTWWLLHPHPVSIFTGCFQMQSQDPPTSSNERNSNETMQRKSVCATIISLTHIFSSYIVADRKSDSTCLEGKCHFFTKRHHWGRFLRFSLSIHNDLLSVFTRETKFYPTVPQISTVSTLQRTERADTIYLVGSTHF